jgi:hypothetical protein
VSDWKERQEKLTIMMTYVNAGMMAVIVVSLGLLWAVNHA